MSAIWATPSAATSPPVLVGAGDIGSCSNSSGAEATAALLDQIPGTIFTTGDNAYPDGTAEDFANCFAPNWGRHRARMKPAPGNHDWHTTAAQGYLDYFAGIVPAQRYWYSYDIGNWHIVALDSDCSDVGGCHVGSAQEAWLRADLAATDKECIAAYWHHPRFSSGRHGSDERFTAFWNALLEADADVVLNGHDHHYERFAKQDALGVADPNGLRQFTVGSGGASLRSVGTPIANSAKVIDDAHGVLKLTLHDAGYDWEFVSTVGDARGDWGGDTCAAASEPGEEQITITRLVRTGADATLFKSKPFYPGGRRRWLRSDLSPAQMVLTRFNVGDLEAPLVSAKLRIWTTDGTHDGPAVRQAANDWRETRVRWATQPHLISPVLDDAGRLAKGRWAVWDVTSAVAGGGRVSFALSPRSGDGASFRAREFGGAAANLLLTMRSGTPAAPAAPYAFIDAGPDVTTSATGATFSFGGSESAASFECRLDDGVWNACASPVTYDALALGMHSLRVRAADAGGTTRIPAARWTWTVQ